LSNAAKMIRSAIKLRAVSARKTWQMSRKTRPTPVQMPGGSGFTGLTSLI
jgi:hypothetical protein